MKIIFFSGSSAVGKSEALARLPDDEFVKAPLSARDARATIGNPSWDTLIDDVDAARQHQTVVLDWFFSQIKQQVDENKDSNKDIIFERCLWDIAGYSSAFKCGTGYIIDQCGKILAFERELQKVYPQFSISIIYFPINPTMPYKAIEARPPFEIREYQDVWLNLFLEIHSSFSCDKYTYGSDIDQLIKKL